MSFRFGVGRLSAWVGLMAVALLIMAAGARAAGEWKIAEQTMTSLEAPEASIFGTANETFKFSVPWYASEIECSTLATEAPTKIFPGGTSEAILKLSSCQILGPPFVSETCKPIEPLELKVVGELLLHEGKTYELFKAPTGKTSLGTIKFKEGTECPLPLSNELKGTFVGETEAGERKEQPLGFNSTIEALFGSDSLSFGTHPTTLKGKSTWALAAGYKGLKWAAVGEESHEEKLEKEELHEEKLEHEEQLKHEAELHEEELHEKQLKDEKELHAKEEEGTKWQLQLDGKVVSSLSLTGSSAENWRLLVSNGFEIECGSSTGSATVSGTTTLTGTATVTVKECEEVNLGEACETHSPGQPGGTIVASGKGVGSMVSAKEVYLESANGSEVFTTINFTGGECPFTEINFQLSGHVKIMAVEALKDLKLHAIQIEATNLKFGGENAEIDNETSGHVISGSITDADSTKTIAVHLVK